MSKREFKVGERVKVFCGQLRLTGAKGTINNLCGHNSLCHVRMDNPTPEADTPLIHFRQLKRLRPKAKEAPREERLECFLAAAGDGWWSAYKRKESAEDCAKTCVPPVRVARLVELREGERILSKEDLASAFAQAYCKKENSHKELDSSILISMVKTLGFEGEEKK